MAEGWAEGSMRGLVAEGLGDHPSEMRDVNRTSTPHCANRDLAQAKRAPEV